MEFIMRLGFTLPCNGKKLHFVNPAIVAEGCSSTALDDCKWRQIPAFGDWNLWDDMPVTQYFESGTFLFTEQAEKDDDLFKVPQFPAKPYNYKKGGKANARAVPTRKGGRKQYVNEQQKWKPKAAVDEDLYKISPKLLCKVKKKTLLRNLLGGCLGLSCIA